MMKFDHLNLPVGNLDRSRDWYISTPGLKVEFEIAASRTVALQDGEGFAIFLQEKPGIAPNGTALWFQVDDVDAIRVDGARRCLRPWAAEEFLGLWPRACRPGRLYRAPVGRPHDARETGRPGVS